jgi:hypothetical protein
VQRARADLAEAKKVADALGPTVAAQAAAAKPTDVAGMKSALAALKSDAAAAGKLPFAADAAAEFKSFTAAADKADKALAKNDGKAAAKALGEAAQALAAAKAVQSGHGQVQMMLATVEAKLKALQALPTAASIKATFEPITKAIAEAKAKDKAHDEVAALAALRRGNDAVAAAEQAHRDRGEFDSLVINLNATITTVADAKAKKDFAKAVEDAKGLADKLRFGDAKAALKAIEVRIDEGKLKSAAAANPGDPQILAIAKRMAANGGGKTLDALIKGQPDNADPRILTALAEGRYGMAFAVDASADPKNEMKAMKTVCEMFAKIPQDIVANTSITKVSHKDKTDKSVGGGYTPASGAIGMTGPAEDRRAGVRLGAVEDEGRQAGQRAARQDRSRLPAGEREEDRLPRLRRRARGRPRRRRLEELHGQELRQARVRRLDRARRRDAGGRRRRRPALQVLQHARAEGVRALDPAQQADDDAAGARGAGRLGQGEAGLRRLVPDRERRRPVVEPVEVGRDHDRRAHLPAGLHSQLGQLRRLGAEQGAHRLPVPRARRMVRRAVRRLSQRQARQEASGARMADQALTREASPCRSSGPTS